MIKCFAEDIIIGLTDNMKNQVQKDHLETLISKALMEYNKSSSALKLDGQALRNDLTPILKNIVISLIETNFNF